MKNFMVSMAKATTRRRLAGAVAILAVAAMGLEPAEVGISADDPNNEWGFVYQDGSDPTARSPFTGWDRGYNIRPLSDGGFIMSGSMNWETDFHAQTQTHTQRAEPTVTKLDAAGQVVWTRSYWRTGWDEVKTITVTGDDGSSILAGFVRDRVGNVDSQADVAVLKLLADGTPEWSQRYALDGEQEARHIEKVPGGYAIVGVSQANNAEARAWILTIDTNGAIVRQFTYGLPGRGSSANYALALVDPADPTAYRLWVVGGTTEIGRPASATSDVWLFQVDDEGAIKWQKAYPGPGTQSARHLHPTPDGGAIIASAGVAGERAGGSIWALKVNATGDTTGGGWQKGYYSDRPGGSLDLPGYSLHTLAHHTMPGGTTMPGGYILTGTYSRSDSGTGEQFIKPFLAHLRADGEFEWQRSYELARPKDGGQTFGREQTSEVQMVGSEGFVVTGTIFGGVVPPNRSQGYGYKASQVFVFRVPMDGALDGFAQPGVLRTKKTTVKPVLTKAVAQATAATVGPYILQFRSTTGAGGLVMPLPPIWQ